MTTRKHRSVFITGGAKGIGAATAEAFALAGYSVAINYKTSEKAAYDLKKQLTDKGADILVFEGDCSDENDVSRMISGAEKAFGGIDVLVNNAGTALIKLFTETTENDFDEIINNDLKSVFLCSKAVARGMINAGGGAIVNVSSVWGLTGASCEVAYSAAKAGVIGLTKALAKELAPSSIRVNCVCPGVIDTDMNKNLDEKTLDELKNEIPLGRLGTPREVAAVILFLAEAEYVTGQIISADGGWCV